MTLNGSALCNIIQSFPVLLILAQKNDKCLQTPFVYKPPSPTHSPEYYEAYDALIQSLFGGNCDQSYPHYEHSSYGYGRKWSQDYTYYKPCNGNYPVDHHHPLLPHGYNHVYPHGSTSTNPHGSSSSYPHGSVSSYPHGSIPSHPYGSSHGYAVNGYPYYGSKNANINSTYVFKYVPNHVTNTKHRYKVVIRKNQRRGKMSEKLQRARFFPQREERRQPFGFAQNFFPNPRRITQSLSGILHFRPGQDRNQEYNYPYNNIPGIINSRPNYDQYRPNEFNQRPNNVRFPDGVVDVPNDKVNFEKPYNPESNENTGFNNNDGTISENNNNNDGFVPVNNENSGLISGSNENNKPVFSNTNGGLISGSNSNNGPAFGKNENGGLISGANENNMPVFDNTNGGLISGSNTDNGPAFGKNDNGGLTSGTNENNRPVFGSNNNGGLISGMVDNGGPVFGSGKSDNRPIFGPVEDGGNESHNEKPKEPTVTEEEVEDIPIFVDRNSGTDDTTTLAPLTPVPTSEVKNNLNFGSQGIFHETCQTIDGDVGSCISIKSCEPYVKLIQQSKSSPEVVRVLRGAHCGFEGNNPKVCCPLPGFPEVPPPEPAPPAPEPAPKVPSRTPEFLPALLEPPVCGISNASFSRVVGGIDAKLGDFPWMALLGYKNKRDGTTRWLCGGSLISSRHVLTAAHCIHNHEEDLYVVRLGELDLAREDDGATPTDVLISSKKKHEGYDSKAYTNDIGILLLEKDVQYTDLIRPICIPKTPELRSRSFENFNPLIAGWGHVEFRGPSASHLQVLQLPVVSNEFCSQAYSQYKAQVIDSRVLCAGYKKGGKDACQGDSGGPLMQPIWNSVTYETYFYQIGVVSFGKRCAEPGFPGVYTRVTEFVPWIQSNLLGTS